MLGLKWTHNKKKCFLLYYVDFRPTQGFIQIVILKAVPGVKTKFKGELNIYVLFVLGRWWKSVYIKFPKIIFFFPTITSKPMWWMTRSHLWDPWPTWLNWESLIMRRRGGRCWPHDFDSFSFMFEEGNRSMAASEI